MQVCATMNLKRSAQLVSIAFGLALASRWITRGENLPAEQLPGGDD